MIHAFDTDDAAKYGVNAAVILYNIRFWQQKSEANGTNFHDGRHWVYNSVKAWGILFPYLSPKQIRTSLETLITAGALVSGSYNSSAYDRTKWYSATSNKVQADLPPGANEVVLSGKPIPVVITEVIKDSYVTSVPTKPKAPVQQVLVAYNTELGDKLPRATTMSEKRTRTITARWNEMLGSKTPAGTVRFETVEDGLAWFAKLFRKVRLNPHWMGEKEDSTWTADFDWIMKPSNFIKVLEYRPVDRSQQ